MNKLQISDKFRPEMATFIFSLTVLSQVYPDAVGSLYRSSSSRLWILAYGCIWISKAQL